MKCIEIQSTPYRYHPSPVRCAKSAASKGRVTGNRSPCSASSLPMKRRLFATLVAPAASYGCEVWGGHFLGRLMPPAAKLLSVQAGFLRRLCSLPKSGSALPVFAESAEEPWDVQWWRQVVRFALRLERMGIGSLHKDILRDNVRDAHGSPAAGKRACQLTLRAQTLGLSAPFDASGSVVIGAAHHRDQVSQHVQRVWDDAHISPRSCPSAGAKLCTYHCYLSCPLADPYFELPLSRRSLCQLFRFRLSCHSLPIEQGRRAKMPRTMHFCPLCPGHHVGDERHLVLECPALQHIRQHYANLFSDAHSTMRLFMWHTDQKAMA